MGLGYICVVITHVRPFLLNCTLLELTLNLNAFNLADLNPNGYTTLHIFKLAFN